jgi:type I restriction enzyme S subunit
MSDWKEFRLGELISIKSGFSYKGEFIGKGNAILLGMGCVSFNKKFLHSGARKYDGSFPNSYIAKTGDIVLATRQQSDNLPILGMPAIVPNDFKNKKVIVGTNLYRVENNSEVSNEFIYWLLKSSEYYKHILSCAKGTTVRMITKDAVETFSFRLPPTKIRDSIVDCLESLDDKIELNNKINQELENLAQTLFKRWFIDFEFPNENGEPYKSSGGEMVDSELGEIPKGWEVATIEDITEIVTKGTTPTTIGGKFTISGVNFIKVESLTEQGAFIKSKFGFIDNDTNQLLKRSIIKEGDVLFSIAGTIGRVAVVTKDILPANTNQAIAIIRPNKVDSYFLKLLMHSSLIQNDTKANVVQAVQANLSLGIIKTTKFVKPSSGIQNLFSETLGHVFREMELISIEIQELTNLRDTLLPKLISGELEVKQTMN